MVNKTTRSKLSEDQWKQLQEASKAVAKAFAPYIAAYRALVKELRSEGFRVRLLTIAAPIQLQGHLPSGEAFYFRCRYDTCALRITPPRKSPVTASTWESSLSRWGEYDASGLDAAEAEAVVRELLGEYANYKEQRGTGSIDATKPDKEAPEPLRDETPTLSN
jgi:hypothetical protein